MVPRDSEVQNPASLYSNGTFWDALAGNGTANQSFLLNGSPIPVVNYPNSTGFENIYNSANQSISVGGWAVVGNSKTRQCGRARDPGAWMMIPTMRTVLICLLYASSAWMGADAGQRFPEPRGGTSERPAEWTMSPIVAVDVINTRSYGEQTVDQLPWPMAPWVHKLYWCQGDFRVIAVVKGTLRSAPRTYLWASGLAGCDLYHYNPELATGRYRTRAWFLREEGKFLRPLFDYGTHYYVGLCARWEDGPPLPARRRLGALLLTPEANCEPLEDYAEYLKELAGDLACEVLGKTECVERIRALARMGNAALREAACGYLDWQQHTTCE